MPLQNSSPQVPVLDPSEISFDDEQQKPVQQQAAAPKQTPNVPVLDPSEITFDDQGTSAPDVATAKANIAKYPENQQAPDPDYVQRKSSWEAVQNEPETPPFEEDPEQERRIRAQQQVQAGHSAIPNAAVPALNMANQTLVQPLDNMYKAGSEFGRNAALQSVTSGGGEGNLPMDQHAREQRATEFQQSNPATAGIVAATGSVVGGVAADPRMWPFFFAGPETLPTLNHMMGTAFSGQMAVGAYQQAGELGAIMDDPDVPAEQKWETAANAVISALMAGHAEGSKLAKEFQALPPADQAQIRERVAQKSPDIAQAVKAAATSQGGTQPLQPGQDQKPPVLDPSQVKVEGQPGTAPAAPTKFKMPKGVSVAKSDQAVTRPNVRSVEIDGQNYAFDTRKTNEETVRQAAQSGELWKLMGEKPPKEAAAQVDQDLKGEQPTTQKPTENEGAKPSVQMPVMITKQMEADLRARGASQQEIDRMTPEQAHAKLNQQNVQNVQKQQISELQPDEVQHEERRQRPRSPENSSRIQQFRNELLNETDPAKRAELEDAIRREAEVLAGAAPTKEAMPHKDLPDEVKGHTAEKLAEAHNSGNADVANDFIRQLVRERLGKGKENAVREPGTEAVLPREREEAGGAGSEREGVGRGQQGQDLAGKGAEQQSVGGNEPTKAKTFDEVVKGYKNEASRRYAKLVKHQLESGIHPDDLHQPATAADRDVLKFADQERIINDMRGVLEPAKKAEPEQAKKATPDRTARIILGKNGARTVEFPDAAHKELYSFPRRVQAAARGEKKFDFDSAAKFIAHHTGIPEKEVGRAAREYRERVNDAAKAEQPDARFSAPRYDDKPAQSTAHGSNGASVEELARNEKFYRVKKNGLLSYQGVSPDATLKDGEAVIAVKPDGTMRVQDSKMGIGEQAVLDKHGSKILEAAGIKKEKPTEKLKERPVPPFKIETKNGVHNIVDAKGVAWIGNSERDGAERALARMEKEYGQAQTPTAKEMDEKHGPLVIKNLKGETVETKRAEDLKGQPAEKRTVQYEEGDKKKLIDYHSNRVNELFTKRETLKLRLNREGSDNAAIQEKIDKAQAEMRWHEDELDKLEGEQLPPYVLHTPSSDIGVKQFMQSLPEEHRDYARAAWAEVQTHGKDGLHDVDPADFGIEDSDKVGYIDDRLLRMAKAEAKPAQTEKAEAAAAGGYGTKNTVFTADKRDAAIKRLKEKMNRVNAGIDPEMFNDLVDIGGYHFEAGLREFADWSKKVLEDVGDWAKPYLQTIHQEISSIVGDGSKIGAEAAGNENAQPGGSAEAPTVPRTEGQGGQPSQRPSPEGVRGAEGLGTPERPTGQQHANGVEQPAGTPGERGSNGRGGRTQPGPDNAEGRGNGRTGAKRAPGKPVDPDGKPIEHDSPKPPAQAEVEAHDREQAKNFKYSKPEEIGTGGEIAKVKQNLDAIELIKKLDKEGRHATPEEQETLAKYTGWGGVSGIFNNSYNQKYVEHYNRLKSLVTDDEYNAITKSTMNAHYTSPEVVNWMWKLADKMGFKGGRIIEPGMGVGYFFGLMPDEIRNHPETKMLGVELDRTTARIAQELYQGSKIINGGYQTVAMPDNTLDFAIGNVPFSNDIKPNDPRYNKMKLNLHDYYFVKTLDKVRPGGVVMFITSKGTMDKVDPRYRNLIADRADLVAAYRLPNNAFKGVANTEVTADLLVLRKRFGSEKRSGPAFENIVDHKEGLKINEYFHNNPEKMFGEMANSGTMYRGGEATLEPRGELSTHLDRELKSLPENVYSDVPHDTERPEFADPTLRAPDHVKEGQFYLDDKDQLKMKRQGVPSELPPQFQNTTLRNRLREAIGLRDRTSDVLAAMLESHDDEPLKPLQEKLNSAYDKYVKRHGLLHGSKTREAFGEDPDYGTLLALETYDPKSKEGSKAEIFSKRTMRPYETPKALADEPHSWVPASLAQKGKLDIPYLSELVGLPEGDITKALEEKNLVFRDPETNDHITSDEYLSGEVRDKLDTAKAAAELDPSFKRNVEALEKAQPEKVPIHKIDGALGMHWIPPDIYKDFVHDLAKSNEHVRAGTNPRFRLDLSQMRSGEWAVDAGPNFNGAEIDKQFAAGGVSGLELIQDSLNGRQTNVYYRDGEGNIKLDKEKTLAARESQQRLKQEFNKWMHAKDAHHEKLEERYNKIFNGVRHREFDGSHLTFPGLNPSWTLRPHQANAVWRIIQNGRALLAHEVGAGKTLEMIAAGMELRRLGMSKKNLYVVPNNMVGQWNKNFAETYPGARVLTAPEKGFDGPTHRNEFMSRAATGDWDGVIVPHSVFDLLPISPDVETSYINKQLADLREALEDINAHMAEGKQKKRTIKDIEKQLAKKEERLNKLASGKRDNALSYDQIGVDHLFVDEAHAYKNLPTNSRLGSVQGLPSTRSARSENMEMKTLHQLDTHNGRGVTFATGTPIANSIAETYNMTRFVAPDILEKAGIKNFDDWRADFADIQTNWEYKADGVTYKPVPSISEYVNVPEASSMFRQFADVKMAADLNLPTPKPERIDHNVTVTDAQEPMLKDIALRAKTLEGGKVDPRVDGWLKLSGDARKISLDPRLFDEGAEDDPKSKLNEAARTIKAIYDKVDEHKGTQLVFSDFAQSHDRIRVGTKEDGSPRYKPGKVKFDALNDMRDKLVKMGIPRSEIAIASEYKKSEMEGLQQKVREGKIRVLMGSTEKLGVGINVQNKLYAVHHLDQPWRPADVTQREGRILRQGNMFYEMGKGPNGNDVEIHRYISEPKTIDSPRAYDLQMFQKLERKSRMITRFLDGSIKDRRMEDVAGRAMLTPQDFALGKAAASGNPDALKKVQLEQEVQRLHTLQHDWNGKQWKQEGDKRNAQDYVNVAHAGIALYTKLKESFDKWEATPETERVAAVIDGREFKTEKGNPASKQIQAYMDEKYADPSLLIGKTLHIAGNDIPVVGEEFKSAGKTSILPKYELGGEKIAFDTGSDLYRSAMARSHGLGARLNELNGKLESWQSKLDSYSTKEASPWEKKLEDAEIELEAVNKRLRIGVDKPPEELGDTPIGKEEDDDEQDEHGTNPRNRERGSASLASMPIPALVEGIATGAHKAGELYHGAVDKLLEHMNIGHARPEIRQFDPDAADLALKMDAGGQYHKAVATAIAKRVTGPLMEDFRKGESLEATTDKNKIVRDRMKGFHFMVDAQNREWLQENHPDEYKRWNEDPKIAAAVAAYQPFMEDLRNAVKQLGGATIDEDYIKRVMDFATAGVAYEQKPGEGIEGPGPLREGGNSGGVSSRDNTVGPQVDRSKARKDNGEFYWKHGVFDFGPSFEKRWIEVQSKLDEHRLAVHAMSGGTRIDGKEGMPEKIYYNGQEFYRGDIAKEIKEVQQRGRSSESKALADALGVSELPTPKQVHTYGVYEPLKGARFENAARSLASNVLAGKEDLQGQAANVNRMAKLRYAIPEEIADALHHADETQEGRLAKVVRGILGPITQAIRQQVVGLAYGVPHMANVLRKVMQATPGSVLNPKAWVNAFHVAFDKELKNRGIAGVDDPTYDMLLRNAGISEGAIPEYKHYIEGNFNLKNWEGLKETASTMTNAFREGGKEAGKVTPLSALAGVGRAAFEPLNRFSEAGHDNLFKQGGIDQRARLWLADFLKDRYKGMSDAEIAHQVNGTLGRYNRASWTDVQRGLAPYMFFPGWDYSSITYAMKHPFKTAVAPAVIMLLANAAVGAIGANKRDDRKDMTAIHVGKWVAKLNLINDNMGGHLWGWALRGGTSMLQHHNAKRVTSDMVKGIPGDVAGATTGTLNPLLSGVVSASFGKTRPGSGGDIVPHGDLNKRGKVLPSKAAEDYTKFAATKFFPLYDSATQDNGRPSIASAARLAGVNVYKEKKKR